MCHSPPPARATVRANGGAKDDEALGRPGDDRGRRDAVDPPAREGDALPWPHHQWSAKAAPQFFSA